MKINYALLGRMERRVLPFASIEGLRPTPDRVRETLFNWLMWDIQKLMFSISVQVLGH